MNVPLMHGLGRRGVIDVVLDSMNSSECCFCSCATVSLYFHEVNFLRPEQPCHFSQVERGFAIAL